MLTSSTQEPPQPEEADDLDDILTYPSEGRNVTATVEDPGKVHCRLVNYEPVTGLKHLKANFYGA